jgi:SAM-dependent methyltransferase
VICSKVNKIIQIDRVNLPWIDKVADATNLPFETESFDIVLFLRVLHHIEDFNKALEEAYRVTKEWWTILLSEPHHKFVYLQDFIWLWKHPKKVVSRNDIIEFWKKNNLKVNELGRLFFFYYGFQLTKI